MKKEVKLQGSQISVLIELKKKVTQLDKMRKVIDSDEGKELYSSRMHAFGSELLLHSLHFLHSWRSTCFWEYLQNQKVG